MNIKRIIPCLDVKNGRTVKGVNFINLQDAGDPIELAFQYSKQGADELVFLDITASTENRKTTLEMVKSISENIDIPFTIGGGISEIADAEALIKAGANKVSISSAAIKNPQLITDLYRNFGSEFVIVAIDTKFHQGKNRVYSHGGQVLSGLETLYWALKVQELGAGEILITSMEYDGTKKGFDCELLKKINQQLEIPIIASGGAGKLQDFVDVFTKSNVAAALAASVFHYGEVQIPELKSVLKQNNIITR